MGRSGGKCFTGYVRGQAIRTPTGPSRTYREPAQKPTESGIWNSHFIHNRSTADPHPSIHPIKSTGIISSLDLTPHCCDIDAMHEPNGELHHRERDTAQLRESMAELAAGRPTVALVHGARGTGRSALLRAVPPLLPPDALVLRARCHPSEQGFEYGMVRQLFDPVLSGAVHRGDQALPEPGGERGSADGPAQEALRQLLHTTRSLAADRPLALLVDDLVHADAPSLRWFAYIARRLDDLPVLVVATLPTAAPRVVEELGSLPYLRRLWPEPLCATCTADVVDQAFDAPVDRDLAALCHAVSYGNPLVLQDLVSRLRRAHVQPGAPDPEQVLAIAAQALSATTLSWLDEDDPAAGELLTQLVVLGPGTDVPLCGALSDRGEAHVQQARDSLVRAGLLRADRGVAEFVHPAVRPAVLARVPARTRLELHARAATVLCRTGAPARQTAEHLLKAGSDWGIDVLRSAGGQAAAAGDHRSAARYLRRALALLDTSDGGASAEEAPAGAVPGEGGADGVRGNAEFVNGELVHGELVDAGVVDGGSFGGLFGEERTDGAADLAETFHELTAWLAAVELHCDLDGAARQVAAAADTAPDPARRAAALVALASPSLVASVEGARPFLRACGEFASQPAPSPDHLLRLTAQALLAGHRPRLGQAARVAARRPDDAAARTFAGALAATAAATGRLGTARRLAARAETTARPDAGRRAATSTGGLVGAALALAWTGEIDRASALAHRVVDTARASDDFALTPLALLVRSETAYRQDEYGAALADARAAAGHARELHSAALTSAALACTARALVGLDRAEEAAAALAREPLAAGTHPFVRALHLQAQGMVAAARGDHTAAVGLFLDCGHRLALRGITNPEVLLWRAHAAQSYAALGEHAAAVTIMSGTGGGPGADASPPSPRQAPGPVRGRALLTPAELRVVDLVVRGHSSLEVAESLFLSKRTVDTHLGRIYRKLKIRSRHELIAALGTEVTA
ncbi:AAA family ATPase [Streptomyces sp. NPDC004111]|uniref:AAA family ATPase n=1 Tax=Streptomyces sp. NPDC004111 TaxID=3364690 RepID=UPI0036748DAD